MSTTLRCSDAYDLNILHLDRPYRRPDFARIPREALTFDNWTLQRSAHTLVQDPRFQITGPLAGVVVGGRTARTRLSFPDVTTSIT